MIRIWKILVSFIFTINVCSVNNFEDDIKGTGQNIFNISSVNKQRRSNFETNGDVLNSNALVNVLWQRLYENLKIKSNINSKGVSSNKNSAGISRNVNSAVLRNVKRRSNGECYFHNTYKTVIDTNNVNNKEINGSEDRTPSCMMDTKTIKYPKLIETCNTNLGFLLQNFSSHDKNNSEVLPQNCSYYHDVSVIICNGLASIPLFNDFQTEANFLTFKNCGIINLEEKDSQTIFFTKSLAFVNGLLTRISPLFLQQIPVDEFIVYNTMLTSWNFYWFYDKTGGSYSNISSINLSNNLINFLTMAPDVGQGTVLPKLQSIIFDENCLTVLPDDVFRPLKDSPVICLSLRNCSLEAYESTVLNSSPLRYLMNLEVLDLSHNRFFKTERIAGLLEPLREGHLISLVLSNNNYAIVPYDAIEKVSHSLQSLDLHGSAFTCLDNNSFPQMDKLESLNLDSSGLSIIHVGTFDPMPALLHLGISRNSFNKIPNAVKIPQIKTLDLRGNPRVDEIDTPCNFYLDENSFVNMDALEDLNLADVPLKAIQSTNFKNLPSLQILHLDNSGLELIEVGSFRFLESLTYLYLRSNSLTYIVNGTFAGLNNLIYLDLSDNKISMTQHLPVPPAVPIKVDLVMPYRGLNNLKVLNLSNNIIRDLHPIFDDLPNLEALDISENFLVQWQKRLLRYNPYLKYFYLMFNDIKSITAAMTEDFNSENLTSIDLSNNRFECSCELNVFFSDVNINKFENFEQYECYSTDQTVEKIQCYMTNENNSCFKYEETEEKSWLTAVIITSTFFVLIIVAGSIVYLRNKSEISEDDNEEKYYEYDVFVCYAQPQKDWVFKTLLPILEEQMKIKCCIHERDFEVGDFIQKNIEKSIIQSRKILAVLSEAFIKSEWCLLELKLAQHLSSISNNEKKLILLQIEPIETEIQPRSIYNLLTTRTCILWQTNDYLMLQTKLTKALM